MHGPKFTFAASIMPDGASAHVGLGALPNHTCPSVIVQVPIRVDYEATRVGRELIENCQPFWTWALWEGRGIRGGSRDLDSNPQLVGIGFWLSFRNFTRGPPPCGIRRENPWVPFLGL